jgi:hypothetical protein
LTHSGISSKAMAAALAGCYMVGKLREMAFTAKK